MPKRKRLGRCAGVWRGYRCQLDRTHVGRCEYLKRGAFLEWRTSPKDRKRPLSTERRLRALVLDLTTDLRRTRSARNIAGDLAVERERARAILAEQLRAYALERSDRELRLIHGARKACRRLRYALAQARAAHRSSERALERMRAERDALRAELEARV